MNKYNKGFALVGIIAIIVAILAVGGGAYYWGKKENKKVAKNPSIESHIENDNNQAKNIDQTNKNTEKKETKTHVNLGASYQVDYPIDWYVKNSDTTFSNGYSSFSVQNIKDAVFPGSDFTMKVNGSLVSIDVTNNMNYSNYEEFINDPKTDLPKLAKEERLAKLKMINIGGKTLQVFGGGWNGITLPGDSYSFIYNKKLYSLAFQSGSKEQYYEDKKVFDDMVSSFRFLDSEESNTEVFTKQPGAIKSVVNKDKDGFEMGIWTLSVDLLSSNSNWIPGGTQEFFLNQNTKIRNLNVDNSTKIQNCIIQNKDSGYASNFDNDLLSFINYAQKNSEITAYFDITGTNITAIYEQCLP